MTSSTGPRRYSASPNIDDDVIAALKRCELPRAQILDGALSTRTELFPGLPPRHDDLASDVTAKIHAWKARSKGTIDLVAGDIVRIQPRPGRVWADDTKERRH